MQVHTIQIQIGVQIAIEIAIAEPVPPRFPPRSTFSKIRFCRIVNAIGVVIFCVNFPMI